MLLNCDLGEGLDEVDAQVMPHIDMANIACGGHAGDVHSMSRCIALAQNYGVMVGAHPSYPDREHNGRQSMAISDEALESALVTQISALQALCDELGTQMRFIKPHGALYNDMVTNPALFMTVARLLATHFPGVPLVIQAQPDSATQEAIASELQLPLWFEGFADRAYTNEGRLVSRTLPNAVHSEVAQMVAQAHSLMHNGGVYSEHNLWLPLKVDTLCVHGDSPAAVAGLLAIRQHIDAGLNVPHGH